VVGIDKLGLQSKDNAYKDIDITELDTGENYKYVNGKLVGKAKMRNSKTRIAPQKELRKLAIRDIRKRLPNWAENYEKQLTNGAEIVKLPGETHIFKKEQKHSKMQFSGKIGFPFELLAKIAYEATWLFQMFTSQILQQFRLSTFEVEAIEGKVSRITIFSSFRDRVWCINPTVLSGDKQLHELKYHPHHRLDFRVTPHGLAYVRISFFGVTAYLVAMGIIGSGKPANQDYLSRAYFFPVGKQEIWPKFYPEEIRTYVEADHGLARVAWYRFNERLKE